MSALLQRLYEYAIASTWFKKYSGQIGAFCLGVWVQAKFWRQIGDTCGVWGVSHGAYLSALLVVIGAAGISISIGASLVKSSRDKAEVQDQQAVQ